MVSEEILLEDACLMAKKFLDNAICDIDSSFQEVGFAKSNPELVAAYIKVCAKNYNSGLKVINNK